MCDSSIKHDGGTRSRGRGGRCVGRAVGETAIRLCIRNRSGRVAGEFVEETKLLLAAVVVDLKSSAFRSVIG